MDNENCIYVVKFVSYDYEEIDGYFTNFEDATKYAVKHDKVTEKIPCLDGVEDLSDIKLNYKYVIWFNKSEDVYSKELFEIDQCYLPEVYQSEYLHSNKIGLQYGELSVTVNITEYNYELAIKSAKDILNQYLDYCDDKVNSNTVKRFNKILSKDEDERKKKEESEEIRRKELAELARLKAKYETEK